MGQYNKAVLTAAGEGLIAQALAGEIQLSITKAKTSNYAYPSSTDFKSLTDMQGVKQTASDPVTAVYSDAMIQTRALFSNEEIASTYYIHNIGLYAMDGTEEVLFCIVTAETPDEMPQYNGVASTSYIYNIQNVVQDAAELNITVNPSGTATIQDVLERVDATGGDISETVIETLESTTEKYPVPAAGETVSVFAGKVQAFFENAKPLESDTSYYVSATTGSDTTGDGSESSPYASITKALSVIPKDSGGYKATVFIADGTYNENITISGFDNGHLVLRRQGDLVLNSLCNVGSIAINACDSVVVTGINFTTENVTSIYADRCKFVLVDACQSIISAPDNPSFSFDYSTARTTNCRSLNHSICLRSFSSSIFSQSWSSDSVGVQYGIYVDNGGQIAKGNVYQPKGNVIDMYYATGGIVVSRYGASIGTLRYDLTLYVATTGSDTSGDGTSGNPFATIQHAIDIVPKDLGGYRVTIYVADGTYSEAVSVVGYHSGILDIRSSTNTETLNTLCNVLTVKVYCCSAKIQLYGLNLTSTAYHGVETNSCTDVYIAACQALLSATGQAGFRFVHSSARIYNCKSTNHDYAMLAYNSRVVSQTWATGSSGTIYGAVADQGSIITKTGNKPSGSSRDEAAVNGAIFFNDNGTQISGIISSGLSCTWGTITGGYIRHGNASGGVAMVTIQLRVLLTSSLSSGTLYYVVGFPTAAISNDISISINRPALFDHTYFSPSGEIRIVSNTSVASGTALLFNCTYMTSA